MSMRRAVNPLPEGAHRLAFAPNSALLALLGQRYVQFYPVLAELTGSVKAALLLGQALYWTRSYLRAHPERDNWFWHTARDWQASTGLSRREQENARRILVGQGYLLQRRAGMPARLHFKLDLEALARGLDRHLGAPCERPWQWDNARLRRLLGRPVAYFRPLASVGGSVNAGLYLSHLCMSMRALALQGDARGLDAQGWMDLPIQSSVRRLCLGAKSLRNARTRLLASGLVEERWGRGVPARKLTRIAQRVLAERLSGLKSAPLGPLNQPQSACARAMAATIVPALARAPERNGAAVQSSLDRSAQQDWRIRTFQPCPKRQTGLAQYAIAGLPKAPNMIHPKGNSIKVLSTQKYLSQLLPQSTIEGEGASPGQGSSQSKSTSDKQRSTRVAATELRWADTVPAAERDAACRLLSRAQPEMRQLLLDEWVGQRRNAAKPMANALGYLAGLVEAARRGGFVPTLALAVAEGRERQARIAAARDAARANPLAACRGAEGGAQARPALRREIPARVGVELAQLRRRLACKR